jgi:hypothetical protein
MKNICQATTLPVVIKTIKRDSMKRKIKNSKNIREVCYGKREIVSMYVTTRWNASKTIQYVYLMENH